MPAILIDTKSRQFALSPKKTERTGAPGGMSKHPSRSGYLLHLARLRRVRKQQTWKTMTSQLALTDPTSTETGASLISRGFFTRKGIPQPVHGPFGAASAELRMAGDTSELASAPNDAVPRKGRASKSGDAGPSCWGAMGESSPLCRCRTPARSGYEAPSLRRDVAFPQVALQPPPPRLGCPLRPGVGKIRLWDRRKDQR